MKKSLPAFIRLCIITLIAAVLLALTNSLTAGPIEKAAKAAADAARKAVLAQADSFEETVLPSGSAASSLFTGKKGDQVVGYTAACTVQGSQGPIEVTLGMDSKGLITGISVGGSKFAETAGLGTKCQEPDFTNQFIGKTYPVAFGGGVDAISGATVTSSAVLEAVNIDCEAIMTTTGLTVDATSAATEETKPDTTSAATEEAKPDATSAATEEAKPTATETATGNEG